MYINILGMRARGLGRDGISVAGCGGGIGYRQRLQKGLHETNATFAVGKKIDRRLM